MNWRYQNVDYDTKHDESLYGFIYAVYFENDNGDVFTYYGKKKWYSERKKHYGKKKLAEITDKRLKTYEMVVSDNDWRTYTGSCKETKGLIPIYKEIICFARSKRELTYLETKIMFQRGALEDEKCINGNIMGRFFRGSLC